MPVPQLFAAGNVVSPATVIVVGVLFRVDSVVLLKHSRENAPVAPT